MVFLISNRRLRLGITSSILIQGCARENGEVLEPTGWFRLVGYYKTRDLLLACWKKNILQLKRIQVKSNHRWGKSNRNETLHGKGSFSILYKTEMFCSRFAYRYPAIPCTAWKKLATSCMQGVFFYLVYHSSTVISKPCIARDLHLSCIWL